MEETEKTVVTDDRNAYELAYLLSPFVPADDVEKTMTDILARSLTVAGAETVSAVAPKMRPLAYSIIKSVNNKNTSFRDAYFGWIKFKVAATDLKTIKDVLDKEDNVIRFLLIHALKPSPKAGFRRFASDRRAPIVTDQIPMPVATGEKGVEMTKEEMDREIDTLLVGAETEKAV